MYKKDLTYKDYNDQIQTRTLYFHLDEIEITEFQFYIEDLVMSKNIQLNKDTVDKDGVVAAYLEIIQSNEDKAAAFALIKEFINRSYGIKSPDGQAFVKNKDALDGFRFSPAYPALFKILLNDEGEMAKFMNGIIPQDARAKLEEISAVDKAKASANVSALPVPGSIPMI